MEVLSEYNNEVLSFDDIENIIYLICTRHYSIYENICDTDEDIICFEDFLELDAENEVAILEYIKLVLKPDILITDNNHRTIFQISYGINIFHELCKIPCKVNLAILDLIYIKCRDYPHILEYFDMDDDCNGSFTPLGHLIENDCKNEYVKHMIQYMITILDYSYDTYVNIITNHEYCEYDYKILNDEEIEELSSYYLHFQLL